jgi:two-component system, OmpR family, response regulator
MIPSSNGGTLPFQPCAKLAHCDKEITMRIAVIEDNEALAHGIAYRLRDRGHAVDVLYDGEEADHFLAQEGADLVVLDLNLPGLDGLHVLRAMRRRHAGDLADGALGYCGTCGGS